MADQSDVENALVAVISATLYPNGPAAASVHRPRRDLGHGPRLSWLAGERRPASRIIADGIVNVSVFPNGEPRDTTRYPTNWNVTTATTPTLTLSMSASNAVTFGGASPPQGQMAGSVR